ncbi:hypothetical protein LWI29_018548 [Acer saccharum]|uniref:mitogen-activated protein kinase kinase n=1 Tax=Acer saccharum TaxID=4024 RepID=A0AA39RHL4_ACESA|nr:hypothetical protein LWI29_018548 [Acer saccharum]
MYEKDPLPIYIIPKDIKDSIEKDIVPGVLNKPLSPSTYTDYFAALLYAEDHYIEKWSDFQLKNVTLELQEAEIYRKFSNKKHFHESDEKKVKLVAAFEIDSVPGRRPYLLSRDFVFAKPTGRTLIHFRGEEVAPKVASQKNFLEKLVNDPTEGNADHIIPVYRGGDENEHSNTLQTLNNPNPNPPANQTKSSQTINQNIEAFVDANRPNPWPNKLPKLTYFIRPKPWPDEPPIHTGHKLRTSLEKTRKLTYIHDENEEVTRGGEVSPGSNRQQRRSVGQNRIFLVTDQALQWNYHRFRPTLSRAAAPARLPTPFPGENRRRSRLERLLLVIPVENQARDRRCAVVQLPVFDPGGKGSFEEKGFAWLRFWWNFGHFGRIFEGDRRRVKASGRRFSERRRIGNEEEARVANDLIIWGFFSNDIGCRFNGDLRLGEESVRKWVVVLMEVCREKEEDLRCVEGRRNEDEEAARVVVYLSEGKRRIYSGMWELKTTSFDEDFIPQKTAPFRIPVGILCYSKTAPFGELGQKRNWAICGLWWINYLQPDIKRGNFSKEEEDTIIKLHHILGNSDIWSLGMVVLECAIGRFPYMQSEDQQSWPSFYELLEAIVESPPPTAPADQFSPEFCSFVSAW